MSTHPSAQVEPRWLPPGFRFRRQIDGGAAAGFPGPADQTRLVHTKGWARADWSNPLVVHVTTEPGAQLLATENRPGVPISLGDVPAEAEYHDGMWTGGDHGTRPRWTTELAHSVTVRTPTRVFGVRGPREISVEDLVEIAKSLPLTE
ncbi:hypothetical protein AGRA3207_001481 [Actinomadura graeca]|uniref:Growth inhibitor PemK n=1 Tax=Actinomadura graeca TaxID=2750812 RepID=A0ABX8QQ12_9ACTN|nr:hypothetical protein [Actinomadura graeca]QXJ20718.1 hypothetical protein AGRA3207_001481 [Actinomadura graeca]